MKNTMLIVWTMLLVAAVTGYGLFSVWRNMRRWEDPPPQPKIDWQELAKKNNLGPTDFMLLDKDGKYFDSRSLAGKVWIVNFFFTTCNQNCFKSNQILESLLKKFPTDDLMILSISCTPELDDPSVLKEYAKQFHADKSHWLFLTGNFDEIETRIAKKLYLDYKRGDHSERVAVIGRDGKLRDVVAILKPDELSKLEENLRVWLDEPVPSTAPIEPAKEPEVKTER